MKNRYLRMLSLGLACFMATGSPLQYLLPVQKVQAAAMQENKNYVTNASFEQAVVKNEKPSGASLDGNWHWYSQSGRPITQTDTTTNVQEGSKAMVFTEASMALEQDFPALEVGTTYIFSCWAKVDKLGTTENPTEFQFGVKNYGGSELKLAIDSTEYKKYEIEFTYTGKNTGDYLYAFNHARVYGYFKSNPAGATVYIDNASLVAKSDVQKVSITNGKVIAEFKDTFSGTMTKDDFEATYTNSLDESNAKLLTFKDAKVNGNELELSFDPIAAQAVDSTITARIKYKPANITFTVDFELKGNGEGLIEAAMTDMVAENGSIVVSLDKVPTIAPTKNDFEVVRTVAGKKETVAVNGFAYDRESRKVTLSYNRVPVSAEEQTVVIDVTYKNIKKSSSFVVKLGDAQTYYVDATNGLDNNEGTSEDKPLRSIDQLNTIEFKAGDQILFKKGETFVGNLKPQGSGIEGKPIIIASYGDENAPRPILKPGDGYWVEPYFMTTEVIERDVRTNNMITFYNQSYWEVRDLELYDPSFASVDPTVTNSTAVYRRGISIQGEDIGELEHFYMDNLVIHGFRGKIDNNGKSAGGIIMSVLANPDVPFEENVPTSINDIRITNCELYDLGRSGINFVTAWGRRSEDPNSKWGANYVNNLHGSKVHKGFARTPYNDFYLANNIIHDIDGDGAIIDSCDDAIAENNLVYACTKGSESVRYIGAVGMFNWNSDNTIFQFNEVYDTKRGGDAQGIEIDGLNDKTYVQYNYFHDNKGGIYNYCTYGGVRSFDGTFRYNIFQNEGDEHGMFYLFNDTFGSKVYNNTMYLSENPGKFIETNGATITNSDYKVFNNIFYYPGKTPYTANTFGESYIDYEANVFYNFSNVPSNDSKVITEDPIFEAPGTGATKENHPKQRLMDSVKGYKLSPESPAIDAGVIVEGNGGRDYFGTNLTDGAVDIGAIEFTGTKPTGVRKASLRSAYNKARLVNKEEFTASSYAPLKIAMDKAEKILSDDNATQTQVDDSTSELNRLLASLVEGGPQGTEKLSQTTLKVTAGSQQDANSAADKAIDGLNNTIWHTEWAGASREKHFITFEMDKEYEVSMLTYLPRQAGGKNGIITKYEIYSSPDGTAYTKISEGTWENDATLKKAKFPLTQAKFIKLVSVESSTDQAPKQFTSAAEINLFAKEVGSNPVVVDKTALNNAIVEAEKLQEELYTVATWSDFKEAIQVAKAVANDVDATEETVTSALESLNQYKNALELKEGWILVGDKEQYFEDGKVVTSKWVQADGLYWSYADAQGYKATGWLKLKDTWYYLEKDNGIMQVDWVNIDGKWYYFKSNGAMYVGWLQEENEWYYFQKSGDMKTGWLQEHGIWYYLKANGAMKTGWLQEHGIWYYLKVNGAMKTGWLLENGTWYYLKDNGAMKTGWLTENGKWYYLGGNGAMTKGWALVSGKWYYLDSNGVMASNQWIGNYYVDGNGVWTKTK